MKKIIITLSLILSSILLFGQTPILPVIDSLTPFGITVPAHKQIILDQQTKNLWVLTQKANANQSLSQVTKVNPNTISNGGLNIPYSGNLLESIYLLGDKSTKGVIFDTLLTFMARSINPTDSAYSELDINNYEFNSNTSNYESTLGTHIVSNINYVELQSWTALSGSDKSVTLNIDTTKVSVYSYDIPTFGGIEYGGDYSMNYTDRSLVDKGYINKGMIYLEGGVVDGTTGGVGIARGNNSLINNGSLGIARDGGIITSASDGIASGGGATLTNVSHGFAYNGSTITSGYGFATEGSIIDGSMGLARAGGNIKNNSFGMATQGGLIDNSNGYATNGGQLIGGSFGLVSGGVLSGGSKGLVADAGSIISVSSFGLVGSSGELSNGSNGIAIGNASLKGNSYGVSLYGSTIDTTSFGIAVQSSQITNASTGYGFVGGIIRGSSKGIAFNGGSILSGSDGIIFNGGSIKNSSNGISVASTLDYGSQYSIALGDNSKISQSDYTYSIGHTNLIDASNGSFCQGYNDTIITSSGAIVFGNDNDLSGSNSSFLLGYNNRLTSSLNSAFINISDKTYDNYTGVTLLGKRVIVPDNNIAPISATSEGITGEVRFTATGIYICLVGGSDGAATWIKCVGTTF